ncbi:MAG TPA: M48 family metallopeptidase [Pyrinomonadaceae bacterium]|nr:M48 family metallopeptidase [Pyrinomonadaceae bacterium]
MKKHNFNKGLASILLMWTMFVLPLSVLAQTRISMPKNKYKVQDDVKLGNQAAAEVDKQFPILNDSDAQRYVTTVGERLVRAIPQQFQQAAFDYRFKVVNARDINAFALPGGPMYVNRGMIEAAKNEGEMAGVMAHEISHVALRHGTAQATKQSSIGTQLGTIGLILGGAILGGEAGAQLGAVGAAAWLTKYSREYETQADILGAQILADAGYDPRDLANMFKTIQQESGGSRAPEWLSSHPDPGNRYEKINKEASMLRVSSNPIKITRDFERVQSRLKGMPKAPTMAEIEKNAGSGQTESPMNNGKYQSTVAVPSTQTRAYSGANRFSVNIPSNWEAFEGNSDVSFAPRGAYGNQGITHGVMIGIYKPQSNDLQQATEEYVNNILQSNTYLSRKTNYSRGTLNGRSAYYVTLEGRSATTGKNETVIIYTALMKNGDFFYVATVSPTNESSRYSTAFRNLVNSIRLN